MPLVIDTISRATLRLHNTITRETAQQARPNEPVPFTASEFLTPAAAGIQPSKEGFAFQNGVSTSFLQQPLHPTKSLQQDSRLQHLAQFARPNGRLCFLAEEFSTPGGGTACIQPSKEGFAFQNEVSTPLSQYPRGLTKSLLQRSHLQHSDPVKRMLHPRRSYQPSHFPNTQYPTPNTLSPVP